MALSATAFRQIILVYSAASSDLGARNRTEIFSEKANIAGSSAAAFSKRQRAAVEIVRSKKRETSLNSGTEREYANRV